MLTLTKFRINIFSLFLFVWFLYLRRTKKASRSMSQTISHQNRSQARACALQFGNSVCGCFSGVCEEACHSTAGLILCAVLPAVSGAIRRVCYWTRSVHESQKETCLRLGHRRHSLDFLKTVRFVVSGALTIHFTDYTTLLCVVAFSHLIVWHFLLYIVLKSTDCKIFSFFRMGSSMSKSGDIQKLKNEYCI